MLGSVLTNPNVAENLMEMNKYQRFMTDNPQLKNSFTKEDFIKLTEDKIRATIVEARVAAALGALLLFLTAGLNWDDPDENNILTRNIFLMLKRVRSTSNVINHDIDVWKCLIIPIVGHMYSSPSPNSERFKKLQTQRFKTIFMGLPFPCGTNYHDESASRHTLQSKKRQLFLAPKLCGIWQDKK